MTWPLPGIVAVGSSLAVVGFAGSLFGPAASLVVVAVLATIPAGAIVLLWARGHRVLWAALAGGTTVAVVMLLGAGQLSLITPSRDADRRSVSTTDLADQDLRGRDLSGRDLSGVDLRGRCLDGVDLSGATLRGARLDGASLRGAVLRGARLERASFTGADLRGADVEGARTERHELDDTLTGTSGSVRCSVRRTTS